MYVRMWAHLPAPMGRCPQCGSWGSMVEEVLAAAPAAAAKGARAGWAGRAFAAARLDEIEGDQEDRMHLPIGEFARVLGGGIVPGSIVLVGGDPGIGKSTLMLQVTLEMAAQGTRVLYVSGEESERQMKMRALRLLQDDDGDKPRPIAGSSSSWSPKPI